jgi:hypothetical protein
MEIDMTNTITYAFDDIEVLVNGYTYTASGSLPIEYVVEPADSSVGITWPYVELDFFGPVDAELVDDEGNITKSVIAPGTDAHNKISMTLSKSMWVEEACMDDFFGR